MLKFMHPHQRQHGGNWSARQLAASVVAEDVLCRTLVQEPKLRDMYRYVTCTVILPLHCRHIAVTLPLHCRCIAAKLDQQVEATLQQLYLPR